LSPRFAAILRSHFGVAPAKIDVIPNGVSRRNHRPAGAEARARARRSLGLATDNYVAAVLSALVQEKGVDLAIDAASIEPQVSLVIAGDGPAAVDLKSRADRVAPGRVTFTGHVADPGPIYDAADVVILASTTEAMPATLIEAGMRGLPVIATDVGAVSEVVIDGRTGILLGSNQPSALAASLRFLLSDPAERSVMGQAAASHCLEHYEIDNVAARWESTLERAASG
jgi:glycosyltransferase involved in cell wall biosynthesis